MNTLLKNGTTGASYLSNLFHMESNGTLYTKTPFDFEIDPVTYGIIVEAKDEYNATVENSFTINITMFGRTRMATELRML